MTGSRWQARAVGDVSGLRLHVLECEEQLLTSAYSLLRREFEPSLLDPLGRYTEWLSWNRTGTHPFPFVIVTASCPDGQVRAVIESNVMPLPNSPGPDGHPTHWVYAIGHLTTAQGFRGQGLGRALWQRGVEEARHIAKHLKGELVTTVLESQQEALPFWDRLGFLQPAGVSYHQPPLTFEPDGRPSHPPVRETLMLHPEPGQPRDVVHRSRLCDIVATLYRYWSLHPQLDLLSPAAFGVAEASVAELLTSVYANMPPGDSIGLVRATGSSPNA